MSAQTSLQEISAPDRKAALESLLQQAAKPIAGDNWFSASERMFAIELQLVAQEAGL